MNHIFAADGSSCLRPKRTHRACAQCRRRKQKCVTSTDIAKACKNCQKTGVICSEMPDPSSDHGLQSRKSQVVAEGSPRTTLASGFSGSITLSQSQQQTGSSVTPQMARFVGHLNPETHLLDQSRPNSAEPRQEIDHLGIWFSEQVRSKAWPNAGDCINRHLQVIREFEIPCHQVCDALSDIYFSTVHLLIPLIDETSFRLSYKAGGASTALLLAVLLVTSREHGARPFLRFPNRPGLLQPREFAQKIYTHLSSLLKADFETDKITLIQIYALMSLHCEGPSGNETSSLNLLTAIHYLQVLGMHLPRADEADKSGTFSRIFWSVWSLDRLNAAYNGRPTIIHERDMAHKTHFTLTLHDFPLSSTFIVYLKLTELLNQTIDYYRPGADVTSTGWETGFPSFEELLVAEQCQGTPTNIIYVLEIYYHAIAILTSRYREWISVTASNAATTRQTLSTLRLLELVEETSLSELPALPLVPYAMTLCLSVTYRQCRAVATSTARNRAKRHLVTAKCVLERLSAQWWYAEAMAKLGEQALTRVRNLALPNVFSAQQSTTTSHSSLDSTGRPEAHRSAVTNQEVTRSVEGEFHDQHEQLPTEGPETRNVNEDFLQPPNTKDDGPSSTVDANWDWFLLDTIPNLVYPSRGFTDEMFNDVNMYDGFDSVFAIGREI